MLFDETRDRDLQLMFVHSLSSILVNPHSKDSEPVLRIGLVSDVPQQHLVFSSQFRVHERTLPAGPCVALGNGPVVELRGTDWSVKLPDGAVLSPVETGASFTITDMPVGTGFHWQQKEDLIYNGELEFSMTSAGMLTVINRIGLEQYLESVISSEMNPLAPSEFLKAHAVVARSWVLAQLARDHLAPHEQKPPGVDIWEWQDREDHALFDLCADDHCQRYHGLTRRISQAARDAVKTTRGIVLWAEEHVVDARFSKCCGGLSEEYHTAWGGSAPPGLVSIIDAQAPPQGFALPLDSEEKAAKWIKGNPDVFCRVDDPALWRALSLPMDRDTTNFFRWTIRYTQEELAAMVEHRTGAGLGQILRLTPLKRGPSGRMWLLEIKGQHGNLTIGKELCIRRVLSDSHLKSSAFVVEHRELHRDVPGGVILHGAGWGHGVGMCQIGAGSMAAQGSPWRAILTHYFPSCELRTLF